MFVPIILGSDKTVVSVATGNNEYWPLYMSIGNVHNRVRRAHGNAVVLIGFLCTPKSKYYSLALVSLLLIWFEQRTRNTLEARRFEISGGNCFTNRLSIFFSPSNRAWKSLKFSSVWTAIFDALYMVLAPTSQTTRSKFFSRASSRTGARSMWCFLF